MPLTVIKIGGSLLGWPSLGDRIDRAIQEHPSTALLFVVGGGPFADSIRTLQGSLSLDDKAAHTLALHAMRLSALVVYSLRTGLYLVSQWKLLRQCLDEDAMAESPRAYLLGDASFLIEDETRFHRVALPHTWQTTSDSIAARLAVRLEAETLVLWKSAPLEAPISLAQAASRGLVDEVFPLAASAIPRVIYHHVRDPNARPILLDHA